MESKTKISVAFGQHAPPTTTRPFTFPVVSWNSHLGNAIALFHTECWMFLCNYWTFSSILFTSRLFRKFPFSRVIIFTYFQMPQIYLIFCSTACSLKVPKRYEKMPSGLNLNVAKHPSLPTPPSGSEPNESRDRDSQTTKCQRNSWRADKRVGVILTLRW